MGLGPREEKLATTGAVKSLMPSLFNISASGFLQFRIISIFLTAMENDNEHWR